MADTLFTDSTADLDSALGEQWDQALVEGGVEPTALLCEELRQNVERLLGVELGDDELRQVARALDGIAGFEPSPRPDETADQHGKRFLYANAALLFYGMALGVRIDRARRAEETHGT